MIWDACNGPSYLRPLQGKAFRLVESQQQVATLGYVDSLAEQAVLEELLEQVKPPVVAGTEALHFLLKTPFRYPPLQWGSRFGRQHEQGIFYAAAELSTTLAEAAYYRWVFWQSMQTPAPKAKIATEHTAFSISYRTERGVALQKKPFMGHLADICHRSSYQQSQTLGSQMREAGVEVFQYPSARDANAGLCIGMYSPAAMVSQRPDTTSRLFCELTAEDVIFKRISCGTVWRFCIDDYYVNGALPFPA